MRTSRRGEREQAKLFCLTPHGTNDRSNLTGKRHITYAFVVVLALFTLSSFKTLEIPTGECYLGRLVYNSVAVKPRQHIRTFQMLTIRDGAAGLSSHDDRLNSCGSFTIR